MDKTPQSLRQHFTTIISKQYKTSIGNGKLGILKGLGKYLEFYLYYY